MGKNDNTLAEDMIILCSTAVGSKTAQKGVRALCRYFGGQMIYVPLRNDAGQSAEKIRGVIADAVGDKPAAQMLDKLMIRFGGLQIYIPLERCAFRKTIALEIYERNYNKGMPINDLAREYQISFTLAYTLWKEGQNEKYHKTLPYLPFLEFSYINSD
jgi:Mor family transcriptional regulator